MEKGCGVSNEEVGLHLEHARKAGPGQGPMEK